MWSKSIFLFIILLFSFYFISNWVVQDWNETPLSLSLIVHNVSYISKNISKQSNRTTLEIMQTNLTLPKVNNKNDVTNVSFIRFNISIYRPKLIVDHDFAKRLRQAQKDNSIPLVNDIIVTNKSGAWAVYIIINNGNAKKEKRSTDINVDLLYNNKIYKNVFKYVREGHLRVLKYIINDMPISGKLTLIDRHANITYDNLPYVALTSQFKRKIAVCAYISDFNTINEIKSILAYYLIQQIDNVIFYCSVKCKFFAQALKMGIDSGYVILYEYLWPITRNYGMLQRSIQGSHINSCYYRHRDYYDYIISHDVDEYFYSEKYPYDLYQAIRSVYKINPDKRSLAV